MKIEACVNGEGQVTIPPEIVRRLGLQDGDSVIFETDDDKIGLSTGHPKPFRSSARALLKHAGAWLDDDLEQRLEDVYMTRGRARF